MPPCECVVCYKKLSQKVMAKWKCAEMGLGLLVLHRCCMLCFIVVVVVYGSSCACFYLFPSLTYLLRLLQDTVKWVVVIWSFRSRVSFHTNVARALSWHRHSHWRCAVDVGYHTGFTVSANFSSLSLVPAWLLTKFRELQLDGHCYV